MNKIIFILAAAFFSCSQPKYVVLRKDSETKVIEVKYKNKENFKVKSYFFEKINIEDTIKIRKCDIEKKKAVIF